MKTNAQITRQAFQDWFNTYMDGRTHDESIDELELIFDNNEKYKIDLEKEIKKYLGENLPENPSYE